MTTPDSTSHARQLPRASWFAIPSQTLERSRRKAGALLSGLSGAESWPRAVPRSTGLIGLALLAALAGCLIAVAELTALFVCIPLLACIFILFDFRIGVVLLIVMMPISASYLFPHNLAGITGLNPLNMLLIATLVSCLMDRSVGPGLGRLMPKQLVWLYVVPIVIAGIMGSRHVGEIPSFFLAYGEIEFNTAAGYIRDMLAKPLFMVLFAVLLGAAVAKSREPEKFIIPMLVSIWVMCLITIGFVLLSGTSLGELARSTSRSFFSPLGLHANDLGRLYAVAYALMLFACAESRDYQLRTTLVLSMGLVIVALTLTFSRGAFFGFVIVNALFMLSRRKFKTLLFGCVALAGLALLLPGAVYQRLETGWGGGANAISAGRVDEIWYPLLAEIWHSPVFGNGLGSIMWSGAMRAGSILQVTHPHNAYLQAVLDMGVVGLILLCAYFVHVWKGFKRLREDATTSPVLRGFYGGAAAGLASFLITGFAGSSLTPVTEQSFLWLAIGMMYGQLAVKKEK